MLSTRDVTNRRAKLASDYQTAYRLTSFAVGKFRKIMFAVELLTESSL